MAPWGGACFNGYPPTFTWTQSGNATDVCVCVHIMVVLWVFNGLLFSVPSVISPRFLLL